MTLFDRLQALQRMTESRKRQRFVRTNVFPGSQVVPSDDLKKCLAIPRKLGFADAGDAG